MDKKKLLPQFLNSPVLNSMLDSFNFDDFFNIEDAFQCFGIDYCYGNWLDNLGALIGVTRPVLEKSFFEYLSYGELKNPFDYSLVFSKNGDNEKLEKAPVSDEIYKKIIKSRIFTRNTKTYSINDLETLAKLLLDGEVTKFSANLSITENGTKIFITDIDKDVYDEIENKVLLEGFEIDHRGRKKFFFPWPHFITDVDVDVKVEAIQKKEG